MTADRLNERTGAIVLAAGIVSLEFAAAVTSFVASTLLPVVAADLDARTSLALLIAGSTLGLFVALPLASRVLRLLGTHGTLGTGILAYVGGLVLAATARTAWVFALGQFANGLAGGLLAVFGISSAIRHLDERLRLRVVAASSAMWILPALVGPAATLGLEHLVGWRWTLLVPVPFVLFGRLLVVRAVRGDCFVRGFAPSRGLRHPDPQKRDPVDESAHRPPARALLIPLGAAGVVLSMGSWPLAIVGAVVALAGTITIMPAGTARFRPGTPAALAAMALFAVGYFGADSLITVLVTAGLGLSLGQAAIVLSAAPLAWGVTSLFAARFTSERSKRRFPVGGLGLAALGTAVPAAGLVVAIPFAVTVAAWALGGVGVGLAYPGLYIRATTAGASGFTAAELATAVITAEGTGQLLGRAIGGTLSSTGGPGGLLASYVLFAIVLTAAAGTARRTASRRIISEQSP